MGEAGRVVFPLFAISLGLGIRSLSADRLRGVVVRLLLLAVLAQLAAYPLQAAGVRGDWLNVCVTLASGVALVWADGLRGWQRVAVVLVAFFVCLPAEYGFVGAAVVWACARGRAGWLVVLLGVLSVYQLTPVPMLALLMVAVTVASFRGEYCRAPRRLFGWAYVLQFVGFSFVVGV